jgi:hypothetical protein
MGNLSRRKIKPIKQSPVNFSAIAMASRAGKEALKRLLEKLYS